jgi:hypothetical protein
MGIGPGKGGRRDEDPYKWPLHAPDPPPSPIPVLFVVAVVLMLLWLLLGK